MIQKFSVINHKTVKCTFQYILTPVLPKSLSGLGPIPSQGLGESDSCSMCGNKQNYSLGISTLSGTCQLTSCDKLDFSVRRYMREGSRLRVVSKLVFSTF